MLCGAFDAPAHAWSDDHHNVVGFHHFLEGHDLHVMHALDAVVEFGCIELEVALSCFDKSFFP